MSRQRLAITRYLPAFVGSPGDQLPTLASAAVFFLVIASQYVIKPVRNSVFVQRVGADNLPYVYIATALVIGLLISWYSRHLVGRLSPRQLIPATYAFFASNLLLFSWLLRHDSLATSATFYVRTKLYPVLTVSQFWLLMNALFEPRQARWAFGPIGTGGILGGIAGPHLRGWWQSRLERRTFSSCRRWRSARAQSFRRPAASDASGASCGIQEVGMRKAFSHAWFVVVVHWQLEQLQCWPLVLPGGRDASAASREEQQEAPRFRSGVELVNVTATVTDEQGQFVSGLQLEDFIV